jgi:protein TonB
MFDSVLGRGSAPRSRFGTGAIVSVCAHVALVGVALWLSSGRAVETKEETIVKFFAAPAPPPPPPAAKGASSTPKVEPKVEKKKPVRKPDVIVQPKEIPREKPAEAEPEASPEPAVEDEPEGVEGGVEGGVPGGVVGGVVGGTLGGQVGAQGSGSEVLPFGEGMSRPVQIEGRDPVYTREALEARVEGLMIVKCVISVEGKLERCRVIKPLPHMEKAVLEALATKRFSPVTFQGRPVSVDYVFNIRLVMPSR